MEILGPNHTITKIKGSTAEWRGQRIGEPEDRTTELSQSVET